MRARDNAIFIKQIASSSSLNRDIYFQMNNSFLIEAPSKARKLHLEIFMDGCTNVFLKEKKTLWIARSHQNGEYDIDLSQ